MYEWLVKLAPETVESVLAGTADVWNMIERAQQIPGSTLCLDESWAGLHFVLTGEVPTLKYQALEMGISWSDDSLENVLMGGSPTKHEDGVGVIRCSTPAEVQHMAAKLSVIDVVQIIRWYDAEALIENDIPPPIWHDSASALRWLSTHYADLKKFYQQAAKAGDGLLMYIL